MSNRLTRRTLLLLVALVFRAAELFIVAAEEPRPVKVFLLAGQSNMVGSDAHPDRIDQYPDFRGTGLPQADVLFVQLPDPPQTAPASWGPLAPGDSFGPELTFAHALKSAGAGPLALIKSAIGGTTIAFDWNPDAPENGQKLYPRTLRLVRESLADLDRRGVKYQLEAVLWHQGENDMLDRKLNSKYAEGLTRLIAQLRKDLQVPELKWFIGEVSEKGIWGMDNRRNLAILRQQQDQVLQADPLLRWVPTSHLAFEVMDSGQPHYHFGTQGQLQLGKAFAAAYLESIGKSPTPQDHSDKDRLPAAKPARVHLFVLAGQRNMEGEDAFVSQIPTVAGFESLSKPQADVMYRYALGGGVKVSKDWERLGPVDFLGNFGPELSFGARLRKSMDARDGIAIVKFTHSGAQGPDWIPQGSAESRRNLYAKFAAFIREASEDLKRRGYECTIEGIFWHVGENDTYFEPYVKNYTGWMRGLIEQVRLDLGQPKLPWFITEQHPSAPWKNMETINKGMRTLAQSDPAIQTIATAHLPHERLHFGTKGTLLLGETMAEAYLRRK